MHVILVHQKCAKALSGESALLKETNLAQKYEILETVYSLLILYLSDNVLRQVDNENTVAKIWLKLEHLYMTKSLSNKIYLNEQFF